MTAQRPQRVIAKFGTNLLTGGGDRLDTLVLEDLVRQVAELRAGSAEVAIVTSGAVAAGRARVGARSDQTSIGQRQALAAIGQAHLVERYDQLLQRHDLTAAQALITRADVAERLGYLNVRNTLLRLLRFGVVPIINENDVVADEELRGGSFGENDALSALVANLIDADLLILLRSTPTASAAPRRHARRSSMRTRRCRRRRESCSARRLVRRIVAVHGRARRHRRPARSRGRADRLYSAADRARRQPDRRLRPADRLLSDVGSLRPRTALR